MYLLFIIIYFLMRNCIFIYEELYFCFSDMTFVSFCEFTCTLTDLITPFVDDWHVDVIDKDRKFLAGGWPVRCPHPLVHIALYSSLQDKQTVILYVTKTYVVQTVLKDQATALSSYIMGIRDQIECVNVRHYNSIQEISSSSSSKIQHSSTFEDDWCIQTRN